MLRAAFQFFTLGYAATIVVGLLVALGLVYGVYLRRLARASLALEHAATTRGRSTPAGPPALHPGPGRQGRGAAQVPGPRHLVGAGIVLFLLWTPCRSSTWG